MKGFRPVLVVGMALGALLSGAISPVSAQIYRWTDERGAVRYSQGIHSVPPPFRGGAVMMSAPSRPAAPAPAAPEPAASSSPAAGVARIPYT
ncbi:MAG: DUF4124 domain-containing protein, partial [Candidatus Rokuibacteriota bacterium]